jgi:hypothetical protein
MSDVSIKKITASSKRKSATNDATQTKKSRKTTQAAGDQFTTCTQPQADLTCLQPASNQSIPCAQAASSVLEASSLNSSNKSSLSFISGNVRNEVLNSVETREDCRKILEALVNKSRANIFKKKKYSFGNTEKEYG